MATKLKNNNEKYKLDATNIVFLIGFVAITIIFAVIMILVIARPGVIKNIDDVEQIRLSEYDTLGSDKNTEYLILVYSSKKNNNYKLSTYRNELIEDVVVRYANYVKENGGKKIYAIDMSKDLNKDAISKLNLTDEGDIPALLVMKYSNGSSSINSTKKTTATINDYLEGLM